MLKCLVLEADQMHLKRTGVNMFSQKHPFGSIPFYVSQQVIKDVNKANINFSQVWSSYIIYGTFCNGSTAYWCSLIVKIIILLWEVPSDCDCQKLERYRLNFNKGSKERGKNIFGTTALFSRSAVKLCLLNWNKMQIQCSKKNKPIKKQTNLI